MNWISVKDEKPVEGETVLLAHDTYGTIMGHISHSPVPDSWVNKSAAEWFYLSKPPTHWMRIPAPPEGKE